MFMTIGRIGHSPGAILAAMLLELAYRRAADGLNVEVHFVSALFALTLDRE